jgi:hypothetical protein
MPWHITEGQQLVLQAMQVLRRACQLPLRLCSVASLEQQRCRFYGKARGRRRLGKFMDGYAQKGPGVGPTAAAWWPRGLLQCSASVPNPTKT